MRRLNILSQQFFGAGNHPFVPELIDIICPDPVAPRQLQSRSMQGESFKDMKNQELDLSQICIVLEFVETDFD